MREPRRTERPGRHRRRRRGAGPLSAGVAALGLVLLATGRTAAFWTDEGSVTGTSLTAGTIDLRVDGQDVVVGYASLSASAMVPGSSRAAVLVVANAGTAALSWTATTTATDPGGRGLAGYVTVRATGDAATAGSGTAMTCPGPALVGSGSSLNASLVSTPRRLDPGGSETLCVQLTLSATAPSSLQGATTTIELVVTGTSAVS